MSNIAFFRPEFFWALLFLILIFILHLLKRPRLVHLDFSSLRFLQSDAIISSKSRNIRKLLQLLLRILTVVMIIVLFARPFNSEMVTNCFKNPQVSVYVWIDHTYSMNYKNSLDKPIGLKCLDMVDSLYKILPSTSKVFLFDNEVREFRLYNRESTPFNNTGSIDFSSALEAFNKTGKNATDNVFIICSDFQENSCQNIDSLLKKNSFRYPVILAQYKPDSPWNFSIKNIGYDNGTITAQVTAQGKRLGSGSVITNSGKMKSGEALIQVNKDSSESVQIEVGNMPFTHGSITLNVKDPLEFDNMDYLSSNKNDARIIIVGNPENNFVIATAIRANGGDRWGNIVLKRESELTYDDLDGSGVVIVNSTERQSKALEAFCAAKGNDSTLVIYCMSPDKSYTGRNTTPISRAFSNFAVPELKTLERPAYPVLQDTVSELWRNFPHKNIEDAAITEYYNRLPGTPILKMNNGDILASSLTDLSGRPWVLFSTSIGITSDNTLCQTGFYVPMIDRILQFLVSKRRVTNGTLKVNDPLRNPFFGSKYGVVLYDQNDKYMNDLAGQKFISFKKPGLYKIVPQNKPPLFLKVCVDEQESILKYRDPFISKGNPSVVMVDGKMLLSVVKNKANDLSGFLPWFVLIGIMLSEIILSRNLSKKSA